jgi:LysM repeat protein
MSRTRRISRALLAALSLVLALGVVFWIHQLTQNRSLNSPATRPSALAEATPVPGELSRAAPRPPLETSTPAVPVTAIELSGPAGAGAASQPALLLSYGPATQPALTLPSPGAPGEGEMRRARGAGSLVSVGMPSDPLGDARARLEAGRYLEARRTLNAAMASNQLAAGQIASAKQLLNTINATVVFSTRRFADDEYGGTYTVQSGDRLSKIAAEHDVTWELLGRLNGLSDPKKLRAGQTIKVVKGPFHAVVLKKAFTLELYLGSPGERGSIYVSSFPDGLGRDDSTPEGVWMVDPHAKIRHPTYYSPRGEGIIQADDPANPLGGYWIGLAGIDGHAVGKTSYGIHGTIHPESIGRQESMGCIRMRNEDVAQVFEMLVEGKSTVTVRE